MKLEPFSNGKFTGWIKSGLSLPPSLLEEPRTAARLPGAETLLDCEGRKIVRVNLERSHRCQPCFVYTFMNSSLSRSFRPNYAFHILRMSEKLRRDGFSTMEVLAAFRPRWQFLNWNSFLIAGELESVLELPSRGNHVYRLHEWARFDASIARAVAQQLAEFHSRGYVHGDLKTRHILTRSNGVPTDASHRQVLFVDLEKTKRIHRMLTPLHDLYAARDLIQLLASLPEELEGRNIQSARDLLIAEYFEHRHLPAPRRSIIRRVMGLYQPGGKLRQGKTVLQALCERRRPALRIDASPRAVTCVDPKERGVSPEAQGVSKRR
jgi:hypothetical protein